MSLDHYKMRYRNKTNTVATRTTRVRKCPECKSKLNYHSECGCGYQKEFPPGQRLARNARCPLCNEYLGEGLSCRNGDYEEGW